MRKFRGITDIAGKMRENRPRWFGRVERKNNKDEDRIRVDGNHGRGQAKEDVNEGRLGKI